MSNRYPGGFITADEPTVNTNEADGIWTLEQQAGYQGQGVWPLPAQLIQRSLRFNSADSTYLSWNPASAGNRKTWTWSGWVKRSTTTTNDMLFCSYTDNNNRFVVYLQNDNKLIFFNAAGSEASPSARLDTNALYRDVSAWYHFIVSVDTTQATSSDRIKIYVNGEQISSFSVTGYPTQNSDLYVNTTATHYIGNQPYSGSNTTPNMYFAEVHFVDGQALTPSSFGYTNASTGVWTPIAYAGTYGQNGFYLPFNDNSAAINLGLNGIPYTTDQAWPNTSLLLNTNGTNAAQNNTFLDSSDNTFTVTRNGNTTQGRFSPFAVAEGEWSNYFDGNGDAIYATETSGQFTFGTGDYEYSAWINTNSPLGGQQTIFSRDSTGNTSVPYIYIVGGSGTVALYYSSNIVVGSTVLAANTWYYITVSRVSGTTRLFINGVLDGSAADTTNLTAAGKLVIGGQWTGNTNMFNGYISNARVVKGSGVTSVTVPTAPLTAISGTELLTCQSNRFVDNSSNAFALTVGGNPSVQPFSPFTPTADYSPTVNGGSSYHDGVDDFVSVPSGTSSFAFGTGDFTVEFWLYANSSSANHGLVAPDITGTYWSSIIAANLIYWQSANGSTNLFSASYVGYYNQWTHVAFVRNSGTTKLYLNGVEKASAADSTNYTLTGASYRVGCDFDNAAYLTGYMSSVRIVKGAAIYTSAFTPPTAPLTNAVPSGTTELLLNFTNAGIVDATGVNNLETVGNAQVSTSVTKWGSSVAFDGTGDALSISYSPIFSFGTGDFTVEFWINKNNSNDGFIMNCGENTSVGNWALILSSGNLYWQSRYNVTNLYFRSASSILDGDFHHVAITRSSGVQRMFFDGVIQGATVADTTDYVVTSGARIAIGLNNLSGYIEDLRITKGYARYTGNFTVPDAPFAYDKSDINYKQWTPNNFSVTAGAGNDSLVDSPTRYGTDTGAGGEVRGNYATLNPLDPPTTNFTKTGTNGNLDGVITSTGAGGCGFFTTQAVSTGKWYVEITVNSYSVAGNFDLGIINASQTRTTGNGTYGAIGYSPYGYCVFTSGAYGNNNTSSSSGTSYVTTDVIGIAFDADNGKLWFRKNGTWMSSGDPAAGTNAAFSSIPSGEYVFGFGCAAGTSGRSTGATLNAGQRPFAYTAPSGFKALVTTNLPEPTVLQGDDYFNTVTYTGTGTTQSITGVGFEPSFVWFKARNVARSHRLVDAVRGVQKDLFSDSTGAENTTTTGLSSFDSDGFTVGGGAGYNASTETQVAWNWKANGSGSSNTDGTISSTVSANQTAGFSIVSYTGTGPGSAANEIEVGHGLGVAPKLVIVKSRSSSANWFVFTTVIDGTNDFLYLNTTDAVGNSGNNVPTSSVFYAGGSLNTNTYNYIAYCFAEVSGYSSFGKYTGNGSTDGPFVYTGLRPAWVLFKRTNTTSSWVIFDAVRNTYNVIDKYLYPDLSLTEQTASAVDFTSNGFKLRSTNAELNGSGSTYIYAAFAENPFKYSLAR